MRHVDRSAPRSAARRQRGQSSFGARGREETNVKHGQRGPAGTAPRRGCVLGLVARAEHPTKVSGVSPAEAQSWRYLSPGGHGACDALSHEPVLGTRSECHPPSRSPERSQRCTRVTPIATSLDGDVLGRVPFSQLHNNLQKKLIDIKK